jgi:hypothetical protein
MARAKGNAEVVRAEVLLRAPNPATFERVAGALRHKGVEVTARGAASLSIRCPRQLFEQVFATHLSARGPEQPGEGVRDFGALGHPAFEAQPPAQAPAEIAADVEGVYLQAPPQLL